MLSLNNQISLHKKHADINEHIFSSKILKRKLNTNIEINTRVALNADKSYEADVGGIALSNRTVNKRIKIWSKVVQIYWNLVIGEEKRLEILAV